MVATAWMDWASLCSRSTHLITSRMLITGTNRDASESSTATKLPAWGPSVNTSIHPEESTTAGWKLTAGKPPAQRCSPHAEILEGQQRTGSQPAEAASLSFSSSRGDILPGSQRCGEATAISRDSAHAYEQTYESNPRRWSLSTRCWPEPEVV